MYDFKLKYAPIGTKVLVTGKVEFFYDCHNNERCYDIKKSLHLNFNSDYAYITGKKRIGMGKFIKASPPNYIYDDYDSPYLKISHYIEVYLIRFGFFYKEIMCLEYQLSVLV